MNDDTRQMIEENVMNGYEKIDQYNPEAVGRIAEKYRALLRKIAISKEGGSRETMIWDKGECHK